MENVIPPAHIMSLARDLRRGRWLVADSAELLPIAVSFLEKHPLDPIQRVECEVALRQASSAIDDFQSKKEKRQCAAVIPIIGTITKYDSCYSTGTTTYAALIREQIANKDVGAIVLGIDSGGGSSAAIPILLEAIADCKAAGKPIVVHTDFCCSAAYWIASQCDAIFADNRLSEIGSIGAFCEFIDDRGALEKEGYKIHTIYAPQSTEKNLPYREALEGKYNLFQDELSTVVNEFHLAVKTGRKRLCTENPSVFAGKVFFATEAQTLGLVDDCHTMKETIDIALFRSQL